MVQLFTFNDLYVCVPVASLSGLRGLRQFKALVFESASRGLSPLPLRTHCCYPLADSAGEGSTTCAGQKTDRSSLLIVQVFIGASVRISLSVITKLKCSTAQPLPVLCHS